MKKMINSVMGAPVLWGTLLGIGFYAAIRRGIIANELIVRYTAGHLVEYITVFMFFIGMTSLFFKWLSVRSETRSLRLGSVFPEIKGVREPSDKADEYLATLRKTVRVRGDSLYLRRLASVLDFVKTSETTDDVDQELRYLSDEALDRSDTDYGMVRMFIWAIPILGFLGTVIGITQALGNLNLTELETTGKLLAAGLRIAFDTTALALSLVFILYFALFLVRGQETTLYRTIDRLADHEMRGRFVSAGPARESAESELVYQTMQTVVTAFERLMKEQTAIWSDAIRNVNERAAAIARDSSGQIEKALVGSLDKSIETYTSRIVEGQTSFLKETVSPLVAAFEKKTEKLGSFKDQMLEQSKILLEVLRATGEITRLEDRLNHNLATLASAGCFEETVNSLAATIHLLSTKLSAIPQSYPEIRLASPESPVVRRREAQQAHVISMNPMGTDSGTGDKTDTDNAKRS